MHYIDTYNNFVYEVYKFNNTALYLQRLLLLAPLPVGVQLSHDLNQLRNS